MKVFIIIVYIFIVPLLLLLTSEVDSDDTAALLGLNIGYFLIWSKGIPDDTGSIFRRIVRVVIALFFFHFVNAVYDQMIETFLPKNAVIINYILQVLVMAFLVWGSTELIVKLRLMKRKSYEKFE